MRQSVLIGSLLSAAACGGGGGGPDLSGIYQVTQMLASADSCDPQTPAAMPDAFFLLEPKELFGHDYYHHMICETADPASCEEAGSVGPLDTAIDGGWQGGIGFSVGNPPDCTLGFLFGSALETGPDTVRVEERAHVEEDADTCDPEVATERGTDMPCASATLWLGTRVASL